MNTRPWLRLAVWTGAALIGVAAAAILAATALGPAISHARIEAGLGAALGRPVRIGTVRIQPWLLRLALRDVELLGEAGAGAIERLRAPRVDASLAISSIWRRQIVLSVHAYALDLSIDASGPSTGGSPFPLPETFDLGPVEARLGTLAATGARVEVRDAGRAFALQADGAAITARPEKGDLQVRLDVERVRVEAPGVREEFARVTADGRLAAARVDVRTLAWRWHDRPMSVEGQVRAPWGPRLELALRASGELPLAELARSAGVDAGVGGVARVVARADGPVGALRIGGQLTAEPLALAGAALDRVAVNARWEASALHLDAIQASLGTGRLRARATVEPLPGSPTRVSVEIGELTLPPPLARLRDGAGAIEARVAGGALEVTRARVAWPGATLGLEGRAGAGGRIAAEVSLTADLAAVAGAPAVSAGRVELRGQLGGRLAAPELTGRLDLTALVAGGRAVEPVAARFRLAALPPDRAPRRWDLVVDAPRIASRALTFEDIRGAATLTPAGIDIADLHARASGIPLRLTGSWRWDGTGRGKVGFEPVALDRIPAVPSALALAGSARGEADVAVAGGETSVSGAVQLDRLSAGGVGLGQGRLDVRLRGAALTAELALPARRAHMQARGQLAAGGVIAVRLDVGELGLKALIAESSPGAADLIDGRVSARGELTIPFDDPDAATGTVRVEPAGLVLLGDPWTSHGPIALRWQRGALALESLRLEGPAGTLTGSGTLGGASPMQIALALDGARLPGALADIGRGAGRAELRGRGSEVELARLDGQWPGLSLTATGRAGGAGLGALRAQLSADLARVTLPGAPQASGTATAVIEARGPWTALEATARVRAPAVQIAGASLADVDVPLRLERRTLRAEGVRARIGESRIAAEATATLPDGIPLSAAAVAREVRFAAQARAPALRMEDVAPLLPPAARGRGELAVAARAEGSGRAWRGTASAAGSRAEIAGTALRQVNATAVFDGTRIEVTELRAEAQDLPLRASATWQWAGGGRASATVGPGPLAGLGPRDLGLAGTGRASLELTARATPTLVVDGTAQAVVEGLAVSGVRLGPGRADVALRDGGFRATLGFPEHQLTATAEGTVGAGGAVSLARAEIATRDGALTAAGTIGPAGLDVRAQGRVPLQVVPSLRPEIRDAGGTLEVSARVSGSLSAPVLSGDGAIRGGRLLLRDRPETLRDIEARFVMSGQGIQLREASAAMGGGRVQARGDLALDGRALGPYRIEATARGVSLATIEGLSSTWDADLDLSGRGGEAWLQGGARLVRGVYTRDLSLLSMALSRPRRDEAVDDAGRLHLFVRVRLDDNLAVRTRTADLRAGGALTVQGTTGAPVVFGAIESRDGRIAFRGHDFTVQSASVRFADPRAVDPLLDVAATSRIREYEVTVQVSGQLSDLSVRMSSVPRLPPDDLVSLVSFGATRAELQGSPATVLAGETGKALAQSLLGIDPTSTGLRLSVVSSDDGRGDPYRIWEDDRDRSASATRRTGDRREKVRLEYRLLDPVFLSAEYDPEGGYGADVIFRLRFR